MTASFVSISNIIIDDIVLHTGTALMGVLGGAGVHALSGMRIWTKEELGLVAAVGEDFDSQSIHRLKKMGVSLAGIHVRQGDKTTRAWQMIETDERRIEIVRSAGIFTPGYQPSIDEIPESFLNASGYHLHLDEQIEMFPVLLELLKKSNPKATIIWEPTVPTGRYDPAYLEKLLTSTTIFSPNLGEARIISGYENERDFVNFFFDHGANRLALRKGSQGSSVHKDAKEGWKIPAIAKSVVDVTGAGNAYCGGMLVSVAQRHSLVEAALRGAVSGSFEIEQFGVPDSFDEKMVEEAHRRLEEIRAKMEVINY